MRRQLPSRTSSLALIAGLAALLGGGCGEEAPGYPRVGDEVRLPTRG